MEKEMGTILKTNDLTKKYDNKAVVDNLNLGEYLSLRSRESK